MLGRGIFIKIVVFVVAAQIILTGLVACEFSLFTGLATVCFGAALVCQDVEWVLAGRAAGSVGKGVAASGTGCNHDTWVETQVTTTTHSTKGGKDASDGAKTTFTTTYTKKYGRGSKGGADEPTYAVIECDSCGAKNKVERGNVGECEYCGSLLGA